MKQERHLLIGAVGLVKGNVRDDGKAMVSVCDEVEPYFESENMLRGAPFEVVHLILRYGTEKKEPELGRINKRYSELEAAIELPMSEVRRLPYPELRKLFMKVTLDVLVAVAKKYNLPSTTWELMREKSDQTTH